MKRLVYAPQINVWVKSDTGIFDLSSYVTSFNVHRRVNAVSAAEVTFRNPKVEGLDGEPRFMFTQHPVSNEGKSISYEPMFHPMDPIIITLTRLKGYPVQVFTGYCDTTPYVQMYPGTAKITASCTLKRLKYTYWDPGLPFVYEYLAALGWIPGKDGGLVFNPTAEAVTTATGDLGYDNLTDSSFGHLVYRILQDVGGWNHNDIYVQGLPAEAIDKIVDGIYNDLTGDAKANFKDVSKFLRKVIGTTTVGGAVSGGDAGNTGNTGGGGDDTGAGGGGGNEPSHMNKFIPRNGNGRNYWGDRPGDPKIIVLHATEGTNLTGTTDLDILKQVLMEQGLSVHVGIDGEGNSAKYVNGSKKAYHVAAYNGVALGIEQIGSSDQTSWPDKQVNKAAEWIAYWSKEYNIPIQRSTSRGVCSHADLGDRGGNHGDPGSGYPWDKVLKKAKEIRDSQ